MLSASLAPCVHAWSWDDGVEFGLPRVSIEAVADQWETHDLQVNFAFADGRALQIFKPGEVHDPLGADGKPRVLGAGALSFELVEPFRQWRLVLDENDFGIAFDISWFDTKRPIFRALGAGHIMGGRPMGAIAGYDGFGRQEGWIEAHGERFAPPPFATTPALRCAPLLHRAPAWRNILPAWQAARRRRRCGP